MLWKNNGKVWYEREWWKNSLELLLKLKDDFLIELKSLNYSENTILAYSKEIDYFIEYFRGFYEEMDLIDIKRPFITIFYHF